MKLCRWPLAICLRFSFPALFKELIVFVQRCARLCVACLEHLLCPTTVFFYCCGFVLDGQSIDRPCNLADWYVWARVCCGAKPHRHKCINISGGGIRCAKLCCLLASCFSHRRHNSHYFLSVYELFAVN